MTSPMAGGRRRIDRVLGDDFLEGIADADLPTLRELRGEAEQEEVDLSYVRRLLQGRIDIAEAERHRRVAGGTEDGSIMDRLAAILADDVRSTSGAGRYLSAEPSRVDEHRRVVERIVADARVSDVASLTDDQLDGVLRVLRAHEERVSGLRRSVQTVVDTLSDEIGRRMAAAAELPSA